MIYVWSVPLKVSGVAKGLRGNWIEDTNVIKGQYIDDFTLNEVVGGGWGLIGGTSWGDVPEDDILSLAPGQNWGRFDLSQGQSDGGRQPWTETSEIMN